MARFFPAVLLALALSLPAQLRARDADPAIDLVAALWAQDLRLATVAERIMAANAHLCRTTMPLTGMILHSADQYGTQTGEWFRHGSIGILQVIPGSGAERAGIRQGDALLAIGAVQVNDLAHGNGYPQRDAVYQAIAVWPEGQALALTISHAGAGREVTLALPTGCRALVEVLADNGNTAHADGRVIQFSYALTTRLSDHALATAFAHELAHIALESRRRLSQAGVPAGIAREFGRYRRIARRAEVEADLLSVHLLANAGYDPQIAPQFWEGEAGRVLGNGLISSRIYPSHRSRAAMMRTEIAAHLAGIRLPSVASHLLAERDRPLAD
jgi:hypothetical protein